MDRRRRAGALAPDHQDVVRPIGDVVVGALGARGQKHQPLAGAAARRLERRPGRESGERERGSGSRDRPGAAAARPRRSRRARRSQAGHRGTRKTDRGGRVRGVGVEEGGAHGRSHPVPGSPGSESCDDGPAVDRPGRVDRRRLATATPRACHGPAVERPFARPGSGARWRGFAERLCDIMRLCVTVLARCASVF